MKRTILTLAGIALIAAACTNIDTESANSSSILTPAFFEAGAPYIESDGTKVTDNIVGNKHTFTWEQGDAMTLIAYATPGNGLDTTTYKYSIADSVRQAVFTATSVTEGVATFRGSFNDWKNYMKEAYAIFPAGNYTVKLHQSSGKTTGKLYMYLIEIPREQDGKNYLNYCHFNNYQGKITKDGDKLNVNFTYQSSGVTKVRNFTLCETILRFKISSGSYQKIKVSVDKATVKSGITGQYNVATAGPGINGGQGTTYYDMTMKGNTFTSSDDIYAVIRRLDPSSTTTKIKFLFEFFTNESDETPAVTKTYTQNASSKLSSGAIYNLGTIPME